MSYMNDAIIKEILEANPNFSAITYKDNTLEFNGQIIDLTNFSLIEIFGPYSELKEDIKKESMTASDLFKIIELNTSLKNSNMLSVQNQGSNLISILEYQSILESENITQVEEDQLSFFYDFIEKLYKYRDYLCEDCSSYLSSYENYILNLTLAEQINSKEQEAVSKYEILASTKNRSEEINIENANILKFKEKQARNKERAGYANSLLIVEIVILVTFTLSSFLFLWLLN